VKTCLKLACALLMLGALTANATNTEDQIQLGREKARPCTTCHGLDGLRHGGDMPAIGGLDYYQLLYDLGQFRRAKRFNPAMTVLLQTYDEADMADVAAYFASMDRSALEHPGPYGMVR
jgi:cytochrome c553